MPRATGGVKAEYASEEEVQDDSPYHKGNPAATYGTGRAEPLTFWRRPRKRGRIWNAPSKDSTAYGERNVIKVDAENKRDLRRAIAHIYRKVGYKPQGEGLTDSGGEVGGGHISVEDRDNITRSEERASSFIEHSGEVSDDACRKRPTPSE